MTNKLWTIAAGLALMAAALHAQATGGFGGRGGGGTGGAAGFQQAGTMGTVSNSPAMIARSATASGPLVVVGKPFSATEERKTFQKLGDGTELASSESNQLFRDGQGRTRVEQVCQDKTVVGILDPVGRFFVQLDPVAKTARKTAIPEGATTGGISISACGISRSFGFSNSNQPRVSVQSASAMLGEVLTARGGRGGATMEPRSAPPTPAVAVGAARGGGGGGGGRGGAVAMAVPNTQPPVNEELGAMTQNGVLAMGTRSNVTIPAGRIGNNRDIHIVTERWFSNDLQMLIKSVNSDPRFGENTYQVVNVSQSEPNPSLFQIPSDYTIIDNSPVHNEVLPAIVPVVK